MKWHIKGTRYETCRTEGQCPLKFGRSLWHPCTSFATYQIDEGEIDGVDISGTVIIHHIDNIGPDYEYLMANGAGEGAVYVSENLTEKQKLVLEPWAKSHLSAQRWQKQLGFQFVPIDINQLDEKTWHITMPDGEMKIAYAIGGDGKTPIKWINILKDVQNYRACNTEFWRFHGYGKNIEYHLTGGDIYDFEMQGDD